MSSEINELPLEDDFCDVLAKALQGRHMTERSLAERVGIGADRVAALLAGAAPRESELERIADLLSLGQEALADLAFGRWRPAAARTIDGWCGFNSPFFGFSVNAYVAWDPASREAAMFDTGADARPALDAIERARLRPRFLFVTHAHADHVGDLRRVRAAHPDLLVVASESEPGLPADIQYARDGQSFSVGRLDVRALDTPGHTPGGLSFAVRGWEGETAMVAVVGDALFAGSIGRPNVSYHDLLQAIRSRVLRLPDAAIVAPGHGPYSSVAEERVHNPFLVGASGRP